MEINSITDQIIGAAIDVHRQLGPGLLESAYQACVAHELTAAEFLLNVKNPYH
jgi:GxxExxY protein